MGDAPTGLPPVPEATRGNQIDRNRLCPKCGIEGRVISNSMGRSVFCNPCKFSWPISTAPLDGIVRPEPARGLSKQTHVEPDWDMAYDDDIGGQNGPPSRR